MVITALKKPPLQLGCLLFIIYFWGHCLSLDIIRFFYSLSILLKDLLLWGLPLVVGTFIASTLQAFEKKAFFFVIFLMVFEGLSNASSVLWAYGIGWAFESFICSPRVSVTPSLNLKPFIDIGFYKPSFWSVDKAVLIGVGIGIASTFAGPGAQIYRTLSWLKEKITVWVLGTFVKLIPLYVLGFLLYINAAGLLSHIINHYGPLILLLGVSIAGYLLLLMALATGFKREKMRTLLSSLTPVGFIAFTSMSSAATLPFSIAAAEKNLKNPALAGVIIPSTINIQQVGDCLANALLCLMLLKTMGAGFPLFKDWCLFTLVFISARFMTVGTMGGAIFIMVPIYEKYLGFTPEMTSLIIALNVVLDPLITMSNVLGNGTLCVLIEKIWGFLNRYTSTVYKTFPS